MAFHGGGLFPGLFHGITPDMDDTFVGDESDAIGMDVTAGRPRQHVPLYVSVASPTAANRLRS
jgi:hypothetical protein